MARQYSLKGFLRHAPNRLLEAYFERLGLGEDIDWEYLPETDIEPVFAAIQAADVSAQERMGLDFHSIHDLADEAGIQTLIQEAEESYPALDLAGALSEMNGFYEKAFWVFIEHPEVFRIARIIDGFSTRSAVKQIGFPLLPGEPDKESTEKLGEALSAYYLKKDGRGQGYHVDYYKRGDRHYWFAYLEGFANSLLVYDGDHQLDLQTNRPAFEIIFRYNEAERSLELRGVTGKHSVRDVQMIFSRAILKNDVHLPEDAITYQLEALRNRDIEFRVEPGYGIESVRLTKLKVNVLGRQGISVTLEAGSRYGRDRIYDLLEDLLASGKIPVELLTVSMVGFQLTFYPENGRRKGKTMSFWVSSPHSTSLKSGEKYEIARMCLKRWGIDVSGTTEDGAPQPALAAQAIFDI
ncbi:MAG: hypothetical protein ABFD46_08335 [Armatimonadota bacterium]